MLQYDAKAKYQLISRKFSDMIFFSPERSLNQPKATRVCLIRSINQSNRTISVRLLFLFCSHVFISRLYENRSILFRATKSCTLFSYILPDYVRGLLVVCKVFRDICILQTLQRRHLRNTRINVELMLLNKLL